MVRDFARRRLIWVLALAQLSLGAAALAEGSSGRGSDGRSGRDDRGGERRNDSPGSVSWVLRWNRIAVDASGADHAGLGQQPGPGRSSRAMAIVHIAMFDALNAAVGGYEGYADLRRVYGEPSLKAAIAQAAHDTLVVLFSAQAASFDAALAEDLARVRDRRAKYEGVRLGQRAAAAILELARERRLAARRAADRRPATCRATRPASGAWIRSASSRSRSARTGARWRRSCSNPPTSSACRRRLPSTAPSTPRRSTRSRRSAATAMHDADAAQRQTRPRPASTGPTTARRACARRRASTTRSPC